MWSSVIRAMAAPSTGFRKSGWRRDLSGGVENKRQVRIDAHVDLGSRRPVMHPCAQGDPDAEPDVDMNETLRTADFRHHDQAGEDECRWPRSAEGDRFGAKAQSIVPVG